MRRKYLGNLSVEQWIEKETKSWKDGSNIWEALISVFLLIGQWLAWKVGNSATIWLGKGPSVGGAGFYLLSDYLSNELYGKGKFVLEDVG